MANAITKRFAVTKTELENELTRQFYEAGLGEYLEGGIAALDGNCLTGRVKLEVIDKLRADERFLSGILHGAHKEVGKDRVEFRSIHGTLGERSLQVVISKETTNFYADLDKHNPYNDAYRFLAHAFAQVIPNWFKKVFKGNNG
jgi:hypothetical protein